MVKYIRYIASYSPNQTNILTKLFKISIPVVQIYKHLLTFSWWTFHPLCIHLLLYIVCKNNNAYIKDRIPRVSLK